MKSEAPSGPIFGAKTVVIVGVTSFVAAALARPFGLPTLVVFDFAVTSLSLAVLLAERDLSVLAISKSALRDCAFGIAIIAAGLALAWWSGWCLGPCRNVAVKSISTETVVLALLLAPVAESIMIQGWVYDFFEYWFAIPWLTVSATSIAFIAIHGYVNIELVVAAIVLTLLRRRSRSLGPTILTHAAANGLVTLLFLV